MFTENLKELLPYIALVVSVSSPIITACINNHHQKQIKNTEFYHLHRAEVIENYIQAVSNLLKTDNVKDLEQYYKCSGEIYLYIPENLWNTVERIDHFICVEKNKVFALNALKDLCKALLKKHPPRFTY